MYSNASDVYCKTGLGILFKKNRNKIFFNFFPLFSLQYTKMNNTNEYSNFSLQFRYYNKTTVYYLLAENRQIWKYKPMF